MNRIHIKELLSNMQDTKNILQFILRLQILHIREVQIQSLDFSDFPSF
jgi:hypothetical protein